MSGLGLSGASAKRGGSDKAHGKKKQVHYIGAHPRTGKPDDGFCYLEVPHVHVVAPAKKYRPMYRRRGDHYHFVADPAPYGYDGPSHTYYGHHPIAVDVLVGAQVNFHAGQNLEYCYLDGPHLHHYAPQPGLTFEVKGDAHWYVGEMPDTYVEARAEFVPINRVYATFEYQPPVVVVEAPPPGYVGAFVDVHLGVGADVHAHGVSAVEVETHAPQVRVDVGLPSFAIHGGVHVGGEAHVDEHSHADTRVKIKSKPGKVKVKGRAGGKGSWKKRRGWH